MDEFSINSELYYGAPPDHPAVLAARERHASSKAASQAQAADLEARIAEIYAQSTLRTPPGAVNDGGENGDTEADAFDPGSPEMAAGIPPPAEPI